MDNPALERLSRVIAAVEDGATAVELQCAVQAEQIASSSGGDISQLFVLMVPKRHP